MVTINRRCAEKNQAVLYFSVQKLLKALQNTVNMISSVVFLKKRRKKLLIELINGPTSRYQSLLMALLTVSFVFDFYKNVNKKNLINTS